MRSSAENTGFSAEIPWSRVWVARVPRDARQRRMFILVTRVTGDIAQANASRRQRKAGSAMLPAK